MGVPDGVAAAQGVVIHPLAVPCGGSVHAGLVAQLLHPLAEGDGALGAVLNTQTVGAAGAVRGGGGLGVIEDGVVQHPAIQSPVAAIGLLLRLGLVHGLRKEIHAHLQPRVAGVGKVLLEHGVLDQVSRSAVAPVADADDDEAHPGLFDLVPVQPGLILGHIDAKSHIVLLYAVGIEIIQLAVNGAQAGDFFVGVLRVVVGLAVLGAPAGVDRSRFLFLILAAEQPVKQPPEKAVFIGQVDALRLGIFQRAGIQRLLDLLRGQQYAALRGVLGGGIILCGAVRCGSLRVLCGQLRGLLQQHGRGVLLLQCGVPGGLCRCFRRFNSFFRCSRCNFGGFRFFRLRRGRLSLLRGAFRCLLRGSRRALRCRGRVSRSSLLWCFGGDVGHDRAHGQSFRLCRQQGRCPCAAHSQNQRHGQCCNGCHRLAAGCAGLVKSLFHLSSLPPNLPVVQRCAAPGLCPLPGAGPLLFHAAHGFRIKRTADDNFTLPLVYTRTRGAVNGTAGFYTNSPPGQCVGKSSKWNTFRQGRTLHKAEISQFFQQPLAVLTGVWYDTGHTFVTLTICFG